MAIVAALLATGLVAGIASNPTSLAEAAGITARPAPEVGATAVHCARLWVKVTPWAAHMLVGGSQQYDAKVYCGRQDVTTNASISWTVSNSTVGSAAPASGPSTTFTASALGLSRVIANASLGNSSGRGSGWAHVVDSLPYCHWLRVSVQPRWTVLDVGESKNFTAKVYCDRRDVTANASISWSESGGAGTISPNSGPLTAFTGTQPGVSRVTASATYGGKNDSGSGAAVVSDGTSVCWRLSVAVMPRRDHMNVSDTQTFEARAFCGRHEVTANASFAWSVSNATVGSIAGAGATATFSALASGHTRVMAQATYGALTGSGRAYLAVN